MVIAEGEIGIATRLEHGDADEDSTWHVLLASEGEKYIKRRDIQRLQTPAEYKRRRELERDIHDHALQQALLADIEQTGQGAFHQDPDGSPSAINARMSQAIFNLPKPSCDFKAVIYQVNRPSMKIVHMIDESEDPELASVRDASTAIYGGWELPESKAKILVPPHHREAVLQQIDRQHLRLHADHIIASPELEPLLLKLLRPEFYFKKGRQQELHASASSTENSDPPVKFGYIHYHIESSLWTPDTHSIARTI